MKTREELQRKRLFEKESEQIMLAVHRQGLRDMLGAKKFDELCRNVWKMMPYEQRLQYAVYVTKNIAIGSRKMQAYIKNLSLYESAALLGNEQVQLAAADEYMAHFAEKGITEQNRSLWKTIADAIRDLLRKIGFDVPLRDSDIARLLYESKNRLTQDMSLEEMTNTITNLNGTNSIGGQVDNRTQNGTRFSISDDESLEFHKVIDQMFDDAQFNNGQHQRERYNIGKTPEWMKKVGITGEEFSLSFKNIKVHRGKDVDHDLTREEWHALPSALKNPFVVTRYKGADDRLFVCQYLSQWETYCCRCRCKARESREGQTDARCE